MVRRSQSTDQLLHQTPWASRLFGLLGAVPLVASTIPASAPLAVLALPLKRKGPWPPLLRAVTIAAALGAAMILASALVQKAALPTVTLSQYAVCILFLLAYRAVTASLPSAAMTVGWLAAGKLVMLVLLEPARLAGDFELLLKFGLGYPGTIFVLYLLATRRIGWSIVLLSFLGVAGTVWNFRSFGLVCMASAMFLLLKIVSRRRLIPTIVLGLAALSAVATFLPSAIASGVFGRAVQAKAQFQDETGPLILGGRTEPPLTTAAFLERPLFGWGNAQAIGGDTVASGIEIAQSWGMGSPTTFMRYWVREDGSISIHSMLGTGLVEGGIIGAAFPLLLIVLFVWAAFAAQGKYSALVMLVSVSSVWDVLFSPWTGTRAVTIASAAFLAAYAILSARNEAPPVRGDAPRAARRRLAPIG